MNEGKPPPVPGTTTTNLDVFSGPIATLSTHATRALGDSKYDKRKSGALEVEGVIKALVAEQRRTGVSCEEGVARVCRKLANDFILSSDPNQRKGGLIALAAVAIGLGNEVGKYLDLLIPPVLKCFDDPESRVRYYATEAMYNVCKVSRSTLLAPPETRFNAVFHGLCKVFADVDTEVKNGAQLLDRLLKVIIAESEVFNIDGVVPLLQSYLKVKNPFIRQLLVSWIITLDAVPDLDMVKRLPSLLDGLLDMLSDANKSIRDSAERAISVFLKEISENSSQVRKNELIPSNVEILLRRRTDVTRAVRSTCMNWLCEFLTWGGDVLVDKFTEFLKAIIDGVSEMDDSEDGEIVNLGKRLDREVQNIVRTNPIVGKNINEKTLLKVIINSINHRNRDVRETCLNWASLLLDTIPERCQVDELIPNLIDTLNDEFDTVVSSTINVIARIARNLKSCEGILKDVINKFDSDRKLLENRGAFIVRKLCVLLRPTTVYLVLSKIINERTDGDLDFSVLIVQTLNVILLTTHELSDLRTCLKNTWVTAVTESRLTEENKNVLGKRVARSRLLSNAAVHNQDNSSMIPPLNEDDLEVFKTIFQAWSHNAVAALCLSLLSGAYGLSGRLVEILGEAEITVELLIDADRLVKLLESPVFLHLRMQLLRTGHEFEPDLLKSLFGLLMILPQKSEAFKTLDARLSAITAMHTSINGGSGSYQPRSSNLYTYDGTLENRYETLLDDFTRVQALHAKKRSEILIGKSLLQNT